MEIRALFAYADNCRSALREVLDVHPEAFIQPIVPRLQEFGTIRDIVVHTVGAEERWITMRIGGAEIEWYPDHAPTTLDALFADWEKNRRKTYALLDSLNSDGLRRILRVRIRDVWEGDLTVEQILFHLVNHETHHRGQISAALQQFGIDPPDFDFIFHLPTLNAET